jgi:hypothetical protein
MTTPTLLTVRQLAEIQPALTVAGIRWDLAHRRSNGLEESGAIVYRGRRVLLDRDRYVEWLISRSRATGGHGVHV